MNVFKKAGVFTLALMLVMALGVAANATSDPTKVNNPDTSTKEATVWTYSTRSELASTKFQVKINAEDNTPVPGVTFTYTLAPTSIPATGGGAPAGFVSFSNSETETMLTGTAVFSEYIASSSNGSTDVTVYFDKSVLTQRPACGYYRYTLTPTAANSHFTGNNDVLDLIVYIDKELKPYAAILTTHDNTANESFVYSGKRAGFEYSYSAYDVTISNGSVGRTVASGTSISFNVELTVPFDVTTFNTISLPAKYSVDGGAGTPVGSFIPDDSTATAAATISSVEIPIGQSMVISGLPNGTVVKVKELNGDNYQIESTVADTMSARTEIGATENYAEATSGYRTTGTVSTANGAITYNNELAAISPTGVVLRYAPYFFTFGAGLAVLPLSIRRKKEEMF